MVVVRHSVDLRLANTLGLECLAKHYIELESEHDLQQAFQLYSLNTAGFLVLGGGSNVILPTQLDRYVLRFKQKPAGVACHIKSENDDTVLLEVEAGVNWDDLVAFTVEQAYSGLENLSLIPGTVGAAPIQNIGAYGVEVSDCLASVRVFNVAQQCFQDFTVEACEFAYRDSIFKRHPGMYIIVSVVFSLSKRPEFVLDYGELASLKTESPLVASKVREKVFKTRQAKLPDPADLANAGSFFKNPIVSQFDMERLKQGFPAIVHYPLDSGKSKIAAAWLIDQAGWKGYRNEHVGVHDKQALVIINHNQGRQSDILALADKIQCSVYDLFAVTLEIEPVLIRA